MKASSFVQSIIIASALFGMLLPAHAFAHATPVSSDSASSSVLESAPMQVTIRFSERIDPAASRITVYAPDGSAVDDGKSTVSVSNPRVFSTGIRATGSGTYAVSWQVVSADDGHFTKGGFLFSIGSESAGGTVNQEQFQIQHRSGWPEAITIFLELLGAAILVGCLALDVFLYRRLRGEFSVAAQSRILRHLQWLTIAGGALIIIGGVGYLIFKGSDLAIDQSASFSQAFSSFLGTVAGRYTLWRVVLGFCLAAGLFVNIRFSLRSSKWTPGDLMLAVGLIILMLLRARVSHAAASDVLPVLSIVINAVHLLFKDLWTGGLLVFVIAFIPALTRVQDLRLTERCLRTFGNLILVAFAAGGVSGAYIVWLHLKSPGNLFTTHWGGYFLALAGYGAVLFALRLCQHVIIFPSLIAIADEGARENDRQNAAALGAVLLTETFVGLAVLLFSSILIITTPPLHTPPAFTQTFPMQEDGFITFGEHPYESGQLLVSLVPDDQARSASGQTLTVTLENTEKGIGPIVVKTEQRFDRGYVFPTSALTPPGLWTVNITFQQVAAYDAVTGFTLRVPEDLERRTGIGEIVFGAVMIAMVIAVLIAAWLLFNNNRTSVSHTSYPATTHIHPLRAHLRFVIPFNAAVLLVIGLMFGTHAAHGNAAFADDCRSAGGLWQENVPMRGGRVTSDAAVLGCMIGTGKEQFHFADAREFAFFMNRTQ